MSGLGEERPGRPRAGAARQGRSLTCTNARPHRTGRSRQRGWGLPAIPPFAPG